MIISELRLFNFRQFHSDNGDPGLSVTFHKGLNALIGENDSGKTAVIDALKLVLLTQSNDHIRPVEEDFYTDFDHTSSDEFRIECVLTTRDTDKAKNFLEYLTLEKDDIGTKYSLHLFYKAWKEKNRIYSELRAGDASEGVSIDGRARELLRAVYLKPLRDAAREMHSGRNSRLSQILMSHSLFRNSDNLIDISLKMSVSFPYLWIIEFHLIFSPILI